MSAMYFMMSMAHNLLPVFIGSIEFCPLCFTRVRIEMPKVYRKENKVDF